LPKNGAAVNVGRSVTIANADLATEQGVDVRVRSASKSVCTVSRSSRTTMVRFVAKGECRLTLVAKGDAVFKALSEIQTYTVK
jgi:UrcA family protein